MRTRCCSLLLSLLLFLGLLLSGVGSIDAHAALSGGRYLTPAETVAALGESLPVTYYDGSDYVTVYAEYLGADTARAVDNFQTTDYLVTGLNTMVYRFSGSVVNDPQYLAVDFTPLFALFDVEFVYTVAGISATGGDISSSVYQTPQWIWTMGNEREVFEGRADYGLHYRCELSNTYAHGCVYDYVPVSWIHQGETAAISQRCLFSYATAFDGYFYLAFGCPYISVSGDIDTVSGSTGTTSSTSSDGSTIIIDMDETNGLLDGILSLLEGLLDGIAGLFIPDADFLEDFSSDLEAAAVEHLGGVWEAEQLVEDHLAVFTDTAASGSITIPSAAVPLAGETFVFPPAGSNVVDLKPDELENSAFSLLYDGLALIIDFLAVASFLNMCKKKVELFLLPDTEVITD